MPIGGNLVLFCRSDVPVVGVPCWMDE